MRKLFIHLLVVGLLCTPAFANNVSFFISGGLAMPSDSDVKEVFGDTWPSISAGIFVEPTETSGFRGEFGTYFLDPYEESGWGDSWKFELSLFFLRASGIFYPQGMNEPRFYLGGGLSYYKYDLSLEYTTSYYYYDETASASESGNEIGFHVLAGWKWMSGLAFEVLYDMVKIEDLEVGGLNFRGVYEF